jgi:alpha-glucosidase
LDTPSVSSKLLNNSRICSIYYPPSYYDNTYKQYPLLIMHDGQNLFDDSKSAFGAWKIQDTITPLIVGGGIQ